MSTEFSFRIVILYVFAFRNTPKMQFSKTELSVLNPVNSLGKAITQWCSKCPLSAFTHARSRVRHCSTWSRNQFRTTPRSVAESGDRRHGSVYSIHRLAQLFLIYGVNLCRHLPNHSQNARINSPKYVPFNLQTTPCLPLAFVRIHQMAPPRICGDNIKLQLTPHLSTPKGLVGWPTADGLPT